MNLGWNESWDQVSFGEDASLIFEAEQERDFYRPPVLLFLVLEQVFGNR